MGKPIWAYDDVDNSAGKGSQVYNNYDHLGRPMRSYAQDVDLEGFTVRSAIVYGDDATNGPADPADTNHLGQAYKSYDESGLTTILAYDFKGNPLAKTQQVIKDDTILEVINDAIAANDPIVPYRTNWGLTPWTQESGLLEGSYRTDSEYDALNRVTKITLPEDINTDRKEIIPTYNRAGAIEAVSFDTDVFVERIAYNAKGQRLMIAYGNDLMTRYTYDTETFRMERQRTESFTKSGLSYTSAGSVKEDRVYTYDLVGNILTQKELGTGVGVGGTNELLRAFNYDPLYRLLQATGRECNAGVATPWAWDSVTNNCADVNNSTQYRRKYTYDKMGNLTKMQHIGDSSFTRNYTISGTNNRMTQLVVGATTYNDYTYDNNGNLIEEYSNRHFSFDQSDRLRAFTDVPDGSSAPTIYEQYVYGAGGRVKKFTWKSATSYDVTVYIDGVFEHHKKVTVSTTEEKNYTHIMDGGRRIAMVRTGDFSDDLDGMSQPIVPYIQYQLEDHLQSVGIRTSDTGATIDREEYFPYGETSLTDLKKKRYRYTGKEKDEHSGLYYYGARYYAPWLARFTSIDPAADKTHYQSSYNYADSNPVMMNDPTGMESNEGATGGDGPDNSTLSPDTLNDITSSIIDNHLASFPEHGAEGLIIQIDLHQSKGNLTYDLTVKDLENNTIFEDSDTRPISYDNELTVLGDFAKGLHTASSERFTLYQKGGDTKFGIKDNTLGRMKNGIPVGEPVIRFDSPDGKTLTPHINIEKGLPIDPHTPISNTTLRVVEKGGDFLSNFTKIAKPIGVAVDLVTIGTAINEDMTTTGAIGANTVAAGADIAGGWVGAAVGAKAGSVLGTQVGAIVGSVVPILGTVAGAAVGGFAGALIGGIAGGFIGSKFGRDSANFLRARFKGTSAVPSEALLKQSFQTFPSHSLSIPQPVNKYVE